MSAQAIEALLYVFMIDLIDCDGCDIPSVCRQAPDASGCNWFLDLQGLEDRRSCLVVLNPYMDQLRCLHNIPEPDR